MDNIFLDDLYNILVISLEVIKSKGGGITKGENVKKLCHKKLEMKDFAKFVQKGVLSFFFPHVF